MKLVVQRQQPRNVVAWLYRVVRNAAVSASRSLQSRRRHEGLAAAKAATWFSTTESAGIDPETAATALQELSLAEREVIIARLWGGLSFEEIGALVDCSASTAYRWYSHGLETLRERLGVTCPPKRPTTT